MSKSELQKEEKTPSLSSSNKSRSTVATVIGCVFSFEIADERPGFTLLRITGQKATEAFSNEAGGHRFQRSPPNDKRGRVHTSTITVVVLAELSPTDFKVDQRDVVETTCHAGGKGGQNVNKRVTAVQLKHEPTGLLVRSETERSQHQNREIAWSILRAKLQAQTEEVETKKRNLERKAQAGQGMRGDKRRTVRFQDDITTDHVTGKKMSTAKYLKGHVEALE